MTKAIDSKKVLHDVMLADCNEDLQDLLTQKYNLGATCSNDLKLSGNLEDRRKINEINDYLYHPFDEEMDKTREDTNSYLRSIVNKSLEDLHNNDFFADILIEEIQEILSLNPLDCSPVKKINKIALLDGMPEANQDQNPLYGSDKEKKLIRHVCALRDAWLSGIFSTDETYQNMSVSCEIFHEQKAASF